MAATKSPDTASFTPDPRQHRHRVPWLNGFTYRRSSPMPKPYPANTDLNAELRTFEPLRLTLALGALVLGLLFGVR
jgi:hypothetical protein